MNRRGASSIAANPVLIGAATTLVVIVAVFLAYNANNGLPFVPTYELKADVPSAANLVKGNEVRIGGSRVGVVSAIKPQQHKDGSVTALLTMKLQTNVKPLPKDSTLIVRPRSALGLKYVEITLGRARADGSDAELPGRRHHPARERHAAAGRDRPGFQHLQTSRRATPARSTWWSSATRSPAAGASLNEAIEILPPLLPNLEKVMRNLSSRQANLPNFFRSLGADGRRGRARWPSSRPPCSSTSTRRSRALAGVARPFIQETISEGPATLDTAIRVFPFQRVFLRQQRGAVPRAAPGRAALRSAAPDLAAALKIGTPTLIRSQILNTRLIPLFESLERFATDPQVPLGVRDLTARANSLNPTLAFLTPAQTVCNYVTLWFRNVSNLLSEGDANGTWQRFIVVVAPAGPNNEGGPASAPANGPSAENHVHINPYPNTASPGQTRECEAGREKYEAGKTVIGNPAGNQGTDTEKTTVDLSVK